MNKVLLINLMNEELLWDENVLVNLAYYDIFDYPLTEVELSRYSSDSVDSSHLKDRLAYMVQNDMIFEYDGYFSIIDNVKSLSMRREEAEELASKKMKTAITFSKILSHIPFIKAVCLSGSISKGVMYENSDIDYFLITAKGKVWRTKFLVIAFRILFLFNSRKKFCINYIIDEDHLLLEEKNRFTATELVTMVPTFGYEHYLDILRLNSWTNYFYKDVRAIPSKHVILKNQESIMSTMIAFLLDNTLGNRLEHWFLRFSKKRYRQKFKDKISKEYLDLAFKSTPHVSKSHGMNFQEKVYNRFLEKIKHLESKNNIVFENSQFYYQ